MTWGRWRPFAGIGSTEKSQSKSCKYLELGFEGLFFTGVLCEEPALGEGNMSLDDDFGLENEPFRGVWLGLGILTCVDAGAGAVGGGEDPDNTPPGDSALHTTALSAWPM